MKVVAIIQARLTSTRFPRKVLEKVGGKSMIARVCEAARGAKLVDKVVVVWAHKFPHLHEGDVLGRFREISERENANVIVRVTSDCPLMTSDLIDEAIRNFKTESYLSLYHCNRWNKLDGYDVQVFFPAMLYHPFCDREHVIRTGLTKTRDFPLKLSVDTPADLERVRAYA